ncbi:MAG: hypothetical protein A2Y07_03605 [Planctomycetes bacterium GWF2_50_10]|nr:MAG: hypothetical protein A2Y07_03605 [Planctomycetes bacterium GWF2_50_10]
MQFINRSVAIIKPKEPFVGWVNSLDHKAGFELTMEQLRSDPLCILIPEFENPSQAKAYIKTNYEEIWKWQLKAFWTDEKAYPGQRPFEKFMEWFDVEFCSEVIDRVDRGIEKKEV